jgi:hypothetical protein
MKRRLIWTVALFLASGGATGLAPASALMAEEDTDSELNFSPSDEPIVEAMPEEKPQAAPLYRPQMNPVSWSNGAGCGHGCGAPLQCCERVPSHLDNVWDCYCQQKSHVHPMSKLVGLLHVNNCACECPPPACNGCDCRLGLPTLTLPVVKAPCCEPCAKYHRPRRSLLNCHRKPACCEAPCDALPLEAPLSSDEYAPEADPGLTPPEPVAPPMLPLPDATPAAPAPEEQGWLPLPWLKRLPL